VEPDDRDRPDGSVSRHEDGRLHTRGVRKRLRDQHQLDLRHERRLRDFAAYHAAKGAVRILTKNVALRWATEGVRVNSIHPGFIDTPILDQARGTEIEDAMLATTPMGRLGRPEEVAAVVTFLASDDASFMTGSEVYVDGGYLAR
jgi:NAD(P)-dependent dehydrogenase (short-subunit alcohol dehydrogenase family)